MAPFSASSIFASFWFPNQGSTAAADVDWLYYFILWISTFFFVGVMIAMVYFVIKYRHKEGVAAEPSPHHNTPLEIIWTAIPSLIVLVIFYYGFVGYLDLTVKPSNTYQIHGGGQKWKWLFTYPNGHVNQDLHVPMDKPTEVILSSEDVIHSLFIPNFRVKQDAVPGRYTRIWFQPTEPGEMDLFCAEYCGTEHSSMIAKVVVHPPGEFEKWLIEAEAAEQNGPPVEVGQKLYKTRGCAQCHSLDGSTGTGPTLKNLFGHPVELKSGESVEADENYIRESLLEPQAKVVTGFNPVMPTFKGRLSDKQITALIEFIKTIH